MALRILIVVAREEQVRRRFVRPSVEILRYVGVVGVESSPPRPGKKRLRRVTEKTTAQPRRRVFVSA